MELRYPDATVKSVALPFDLQSETQDQTQDNEWCVLYPITIVHNHHR